MTDDADSFAVTTTGTFWLTFLGGDDSLIVDADATVFAAMGDGDDFVRLLGGLASVYGEAGNDRFEIGASGSRAYGGNGNDLFTFTGGAGVQAFGDSGDDQFVLEAALAEMRLDGGGGGDRFDGGGFASSGEVSGGAGDDWFGGFGAGAILSGGAGDDVYRIGAGAGAVVVERPHDGRDTLLADGGGDVTLPVGIENLAIGNGAGSGATLTGNLLDNKMAGGDGGETMFGLDGDDSLSGNGGDDLIDGGRGDDLLHGGAGNDVLVGGSGDDRLIGGSGDDRLTGGTGNDSYQVDGTADLVIEAPGEGVDMIFSSAPAYALPDNVEHGIIDSAAGGRLDGNGLDNALTGGLGDDRLNGLGGDDIINGGGGNDRLEGGAGADHLTGGDGGDVFAFLLAGDSTAAGADTIADFTPGDGDVIDLSAIDANAAMAGDQAFIWADTTPTANALWYSYAENDDGSWDVIWYADVNGDAIADFELHVHQTGFLTIGTDLLL